MLSGLFRHMVAKIVFVLCTYGMHLYLGKNLTATEYGVVGVVISVITINYNFLSNGIRQTASKLLASEKYDEKKIVKTSILWQVLLCIALFLINFCGSELIARFMKASEMAPYIRLTAIMIPFTGIYFVCLGIINGLKRFIVEATIVTIYPMLRLSSVLFVEFFRDDKVIGTIDGFMLAAVGGAIMSALMVVVYFSKMKKRDEVATIKNFLENTSSFLVFFTCITFILNFDMIIVNALVEDSDQVGYYTGAVNFAKVSYYLLSAVYLVVLPTISSFYAKNKKEEARKTITTLLNFVLLFILPIVVIMGASIRSMLTSFYNPDYATISITALVLMWSQFFIGLFVVVNMCISCTKNTIFPTILSIIVMIVDFALCFGLIKAFGIYGAAIGTFVAGGIGCIIALLKINKIWGRVFDDKTIRISIANLVLFVILLIVSSKILIDNLVLLVAIYGVLYIGFIALLIVTKQVNIKEMIKVLKKKNE